MYKFMCKKCIYIKIIEGCYFEDSSMNPNVIGR